MARAASGPGSLMQATMRFEQDCFDLETGQVVPAIDFYCPAGTDFQFAYNSGRVPHGVIFQNQSEGALIGYSTESFDNVSLSDVASITLTASLIDVPFEQVAVIRTGQGNLFKVGPLSEDAFGVTFQWEALSTTEQATMRFEQDCFDLETGQVVPAIDFYCSAGTDFQFAYNSGRVPHGVIFQNQSEGALIGYSTESFDNVSLSDVASITLTASLIDVPFEQVAVIRTGQGNLFKVGPLSEDAFGVTFQWEALESTGTDFEPGSDTPRSFALQQNYPNPFNPTTTISYELSRASEVRLTIFDVVGRLVTVLESGIRPAGTYAVSFDAPGLPSGVYVYALTAGSFRKARSMVLLK